MLSRDISSVLNEQQLMEEQGLALPPPPCYAAPTPSHVQRHVSLSGDQRTDTAPPSGLSSSSSPSLSSDNNKQTNRLSVLSVEDLPPPPPMEELVIDPDLPLPPPPPPMPSGGGASSPTTQGGRFPLAGKTLKTSQTEFLRERNPFLIETDEFPHSKSASSIATTPVVDSGNSNFGNHLHSISSSSSSSSSKPPPRPVPHKISLLHHEASLTGKASSSSSSSAPPCSAYNPYLPSGSPGLIRRRIAVDSRPASNEGESTGDADCVSTDIALQRQSNFRSQISASSCERRLSNQSQSSIPDSPSIAPHIQPSNSPHSQLHHPSSNAMSSSHSPLHHPNSNPISSSPYPSPAKAKPPPPPRRSSLCKSDKNFI